MAGGEGKDTLTFISVEFSMMQVEDRPDTISSVTIILLQGRARGRYSSKRFIFFLGLIFTRDIFFLILGSQNPYNAPLMQKFTDLSHFKLKFHKNA